MLILSRPTRRAAATILALSALAACSEGPAAPAAEVTTDAEFQAAVNAPAAAPIARPAASRDAALSTAAAGDTTFATFRVSRLGGVFPIGRHWIWFSSNSICDMSRTSYGETEWNKPCAIAQDAVTIDAKAYTDAKGNPHVDFAQHLRFDPTRPVILHLSFDYAEGDEAPAILWRRAGTDGSADEGSADPSMVTRRGDSWMVYRRVKHFSGYLLSTGFLRLSVESDIDLRRSGPLHTKSAGVNSGHVVATGRR